MKPRFFITLAAATTIAFSHSATATTFWTVTAAGTISVGVDTIGTFGNAGQNLAGLHYEQSITTTIDPAAYRVYRDDKAAYHELIGSGNTFSTSVTVNGKRVQFDVRANDFGKQYLSNFMPGYNEPDTVLSSQFGYMDNGQYLESTIAVETYEQDILDTIEFGQPLMASLSPAASAFTEFKLGLPNLTNFYGGVETLAVSGGTVPEPASMLLFGAGLVGFSVSRRRTMRRKAHAAESS